MAVDRSWALTAIASACMALASPTLSGSLLFFVGVTCWAHATASNSSAHFGKHFVVCLLWQLGQISWFYTTWRDFSGSSPFFPFLCLWTLQLWPPLLTALLASTLAHRRWPISAAWGVAWTAGEVLCALQPIPLTPSLWSTDWTLWVWLGALGGRAILSGGCVAVALLLTTHWRAAVGLSICALIPAFVHRQDDHGTALTVGIVQTNLDPFNGRTMSQWPQQAEQLATLITSTEAQVIVTPEGAWPFPIRSSAERKSLPSSWTVPTVLGVNLDAHNSLALVLNGQVSDTIDKERLVPLAERKWLGFGKERYQPGNGERVFTVNGARVGGLICYEDAHPRPVSNASKQGAEWLLAATNDGWLGPSRGADLHLAASRLAAIESRLWLVRPTTTGYSAVVSPTGDVVWRSAWDVTGPGTTHAQAIFTRRVRFAGASCYPWPSLIAGIAAMFGLFSRRLR